jgi:gluconate 2-dehydrogenase gamma chain
MGSAITRREALKRAAWILGGTVSAPTILGVLAGCRAERTTTWTPRTLTPDQRGTVEAIADIIIPETDTPGARAAGVDQFVDAMLSDYYPAKERDRFLTGLARVDARSQRQHSLPFSRLSREQQTAIVLDLDKAAFTEPPAKAGKPVAAETKPEVRKTDIPVGPGVGADAKEAATPAPDPEDIGRESFFRRMKELTVVGYYTSEVGQTQELRLNPWVHYRDIPYKPGMPAWA